MGFHVLGCRVDILGTNCKKLLKLKMSGGWGGGGQVVSASVRVIMSGGHQGAYPWIKKTVEGKGMRGFYPSHSPFSSMASRSGALLVPSSIILSTCALKISSSNGRSSGNKNNKLTNQWPLLIQLLIFLHCRCLESGVR